MRQAILLAWLTLATPPVLELANHSVHEDMPTLYLRRPEFMGLWPTVDPAKEKIGKLHGKGPGGRRNSGSTCTMCFSPLWYFRICAMAFNS